MKRRFKRILSVLLVAVMIVGSAPLSGFAGLELLNLADLFTLKADAEAYSGKCGDNLTWSLDTDTGVLTISGTGYMYNWNYYGDVPWFSNRSSVKTVVIPDSVTSIGNGAFYFCTSLTRVTIPDSVTSIGDNAFISCTSLTDVYYTGSKEDWNKISIGLYNGCLTNATIHYNYVLEPETVNITDERTGIQVSAPGGTFDGDVTLKVEEVLSGSSFDIIGKVNGKSKTKVFTIETYVDGQSVQPNGDVTVRIPVPDGFNAEKCKLYYLNTSSKNPEEIAFRVEDGYIVFTTNRFGDWAIIQTAEMPTVSVNDIVLNYKKSVALNPSVTVDENASYTVTYTSSDTSVARVDENGKVYGAKKGSAEITVTVTDEYGNTVSDTCKVNVTYAWWQWIIVIVLFGWIWY